MKRADVEPYYGATVLITVAIPSLDDAVYIGRLSPLRGSSRLKRSVQGSTGEKRPDLRLTLEPLATVPPEYARTATNGLMLCPIGAITSIKRLDD
jgi:hypothetical protein